MKRAVVFAVAVLLPLLMLKVGLAQSTSTIEGVVVEAGTKRPLEGVTVAAAPLESTRSAITDSQGKFMISNLPPGRYRVAPTLAGFVYSPSRVQATREPGLWAQLSIGQSLQNMELTMAREGAISGRVLDAHGQAIPGLTSSVTLARRTYDQYGSPFLGWVPGFPFNASARMDDRGEYRFYGLPPGDYYVVMYGALIGGTTGVVRMASYYPGTPDETRTVPVHLSAGEDLRLNTMTAQEEKAPRVRLHAPDAAGLQAGTFKSIKIANVGSLTGPFGEAGEIVLPSFAPGRYDIEVQWSRSQRSLYSHLSLDVGTANIDREVMTTPGFQVTSAITLEDPTGGRPDGQKPACRLRSNFGSPSCSGEMAPGFYRLELQTIPLDAYLVSATASGNDILADGILLDRDTALDIVLATPGGIIEGGVTDPNGDRMSDAVVALVPDAPLRDAGPLYRSVISDVNGKFELRGIAPGAYHVFAWSELEGSAYRNADFMKSFEGKGKPIRIEKGARIVADLTAF